MNKPITSRIQHNSKGGMVREPLLNVGSVAKQLKDATKEGDQLSLNPNQSYVVKDQKIKIKTKGKDAKTIYTPPKRTAEGDAAYAALTPEQRKAQDAKYRKMNTKVIAGTSDSFADIPSSTPGTPGTPAQPEKRGDAFTSYQNRGQMRTNTSTNRISKRTGRKELREEKKQLKAGLKAATGANFFQRTFGTGKEGKEYRKNVKRFNKGQYDEIGFDSDLESSASRGKGVGDYNVSVSDTQKKNEAISRFGFDAKEATAKKKIALGEGYDANKGMKSIGDHVQKQFKQGIRGKSTSEQIATGGTNDNRVVTKKGKAAVAGTEGTSSSSTEATEANKKKYGIQMQRGYKQAPKSMAMKALIGNQKNLPDALKSKILAAPESSAKNYKKGYYGK